MARRIGGHALAQALVAQRIDHVFAVPGESFLPVLDGLLDVAGRVRLVTCRFEAGAAHMAEAFGKLTGRPAAAFVTRGPGACHAAIGVHVARQDSTPMLLFVGQIPFVETDRETFQEIDYRRMFAPLAKWVTQIDDADRIPELVAHAVDVAVSGRPGPVVVALSEEMQARMTEAASIPRSETMMPHPDPAALARLRPLLAAAARPLAVLGGGGWTPAGRAAIRSFLLSHHLPTTVAFRRQSLLDGTLPIYVGDLGLGSDPALVAAAAEADLVLAIGTRLGEPVTQGYTLFAGHPNLVHIHPDPAEIGRVVRPALGIAADLTATATALAALEPPAMTWRAWTDRLRAVRLAGAEPPDDPGPLHLGRVLRDLEDLLAHDAILTTDAGNFAAWPTRFMHFSEHQRFLGPTNGAMGYAVPAAVGAAIAHPGRQVVAFVGDGGFLMTGQELATAVHHGAAPIVIVFDNAMYGTIRMYQERAYPGRISGTALTNPDFVTLIEAFGGHGERVSRTAEFAPAFGRCVAAGRPALIHLRVDPKQITSRARLP